MVTFTIQRLWLPKRIDGKWHWLSKVKIEEEHKMVIVDGQHVKYTIKKYKLLKGDGSNGK